MTHPGGDTFGGQDPSLTEAYLHCSTASSHSLTQECVGWQQEIYGMALLVIQTLNTHTYTLAGNLKSQWTIMMTWL